jgi:hypothetical protein
LSKQLNFAFALVARRKPSPHLQMTITVIFHSILAEVIFFADPQKPQQIRVSSPSTLEKPTNSICTNYLPRENSWHSS